MSYRATFANTIKDPEFIVLVASDSYDHGEGVKSSVMLSPGGWTTEPKEKENVTVGLASWKLEAGSGRVRQFQAETGKFYC